MTHQWETGYDGWGVVFGVSRCKRCRCIARPETLRELCVLPAEEGRRDER